MSIANPTLEDVWQLFRENAAQQKENDRQFQEFRRETAAQQRETAAQQKENDRQFQELRKEADRRFQETERVLKEQSAETERQFKETAREIKKVTEAIGKLGNRLGEFVESAVRPAAVRLFQERGIVVHEVHRGISVQRGNEGLEVDLLVINDKDAVLIECKSNLSIEDIKDHIERLNKAKRLMPKYADSRMLGAVASMVLTDEIIKYAYRQGLYVIGQGGTDLFIHNDDKFVPKVW